jgi:CheY-like chemotaxis protein
MILIVEDDVEIRGELADLLRDEGHSVEESGDGAAALGWLEHTAHLPQLILLDLMMPVMDGWEFRKRQKRDERLSRIPVVIMSGAGDVKSEAAELGAEGFLIKPFDGAGVFEAIGPFVTVSVA